MSNPTQAELEILNILWESGELRVQDVHEKLSSIRTIGYTTTLKSMQVMVQKGLLDRRLDGRSHIYFTAIQETTTKNKLLSRFVDNTFRGSSSKLVMQLFGNNSVSKKEVDEIRSFLDNLEDKE
ncbi:BlaI/MecI/CopY family transcriptional regulator [Teredinibacter purpureus]|uniref:BlaI/MecI/CopY family transcriptional regulator n=1 Tax=Teredinibacter purpureus TaxID=2731756 RepID=UPI0005F85FD8|nr:BlaI/MecI/CopY family transcriptional regulator [Teredinibacter purpureus]